MNTREERRPEMRDDAERLRERAYRSMPSWRTRARRRTLVALVLAIAVAAVVGVHLAPGVIYVPLVGVVAGCVPFLALRLLTRGVAESADGKLDERDRILRDTAMRRSFVVLMYGVGALLAYVVVTQGFPHLADRLIGLLITAAWAGSIAPTLALAWSLPDDDPDDLAGR